jgi:cytochrome P450
MILGVFNRTMGIGDHHTFDLMSSLIYSASYDATSREEFRFVPHSIEQSNVRMSVILQAPELMWGRLDRKLFPQSIAARDKFLKFLRTMIATRMKSRKSGTTETVTRDDIFALFEKAHDPETGKKFGTTELTAESATLVVAGSDTTSIALAGLFYYLSRPTNAAAYRRCVTEVRAAFRSVSEICTSGAVAAACPYLRACIEETLRMSPPTGSALWREVLTGGTSIGGQFIPAGCDVGVGIYAIHHNAALFPDPFEFRPERFLNDGSSSVDPLNSRRGFIPFSIGTRGCIGKGLAMAEIMLTMACIMRVSDFRGTHSGKNGDLEIMEGEYQLWDHITGAKKGPWLQFCPIGDDFSRAVVQ